MTTPTIATTGNDTSPTQTSSEQLSSSTTTTRICIKNLPLSITNESKLKNHLLQQSSSTSIQLQITDVKILKTTEGKSRRIAFIGFSTPTQASAAVSYYNKSFIGTSKLNVSLAFSKKKHSKEKSEYRPWSKFSVGSSRYDKLHNQQQQSDNEEEEGDTTKDKEQQTNEVNTEADRKRDEFLSAMGISTSTSNNNKQKDTSSSGGPVSKSKFWSNDDAMEVEQQIDETKQNKDEEINSDSDSSSESESSDSSSDSDEEETADNKTKNMISSDLDFLKSKQVKADILSDNDETDNKDDKKGGDSDSSSSVDSSSDSDDSSSSDEDSSEDEADEKDTPQASTSNKVSSEKTADTQHQPSTITTTATLNDRLFVRNLPFTTTEEELYETFTNFGNVTSVHIPVDDTKRNKGYAFITYEHYKHAKLALKTMDGEDFQGRLIHILPARPSAVDQLELEGGGDDLTYKEKQALARQKEAEKTSMGLSASYLRGDAVVDNVADRLGVSKGDVLNVKDGISSGNAAVRLALGETHIISENIAFFEEHGVDVTALENNNTRKHGRGSSGDVKSKRSKTMILVKNLPYDTTLEELTKVFHGIGGDVPLKMLLPPSKTAALVEYGHATDARRAFRRLAYKKFKHVPLYLEMAPMSAESSKRQQESTAPKEEDKTTKKRDTVNDTVVKQGVVDHTESNDNAGVSQTVYVKNLNFSTTEEQLEKAFTKAGCQPRAVKIPTKAAPVKKHKTTSGKAAPQEMRQVSMGFGFVEFASEEEALQSIKTLQGKLVDGHSLEIKLSTKSLSSSSSKAPPVDKSSKNTKIMVRNVPFEATRTELLQLFGSFGQLKKVRLPKKFDGTHRGFAFCEFVTSKEAQNAMTTLSRTHLYGRHLVLEWATQGEDDGNTADNVGVAREKAKRDAMSAGFGSSGKKGKHLKF